MSGHLTRDLGVLQIELVFSGDRDQRGISLAQPEHFVGAQLDGVSQIVEHLVNRGTDRCLVSALCAGREFDLAFARQQLAEIEPRALAGVLEHQGRFRGEQRDVVRADLHDLWELLTGRRLFDGTTQEVIAQVLFRPIPRPSTLRGGVPADLEAITMRLLERERSDRYANAELVIDDLARCADAPRNGRSELARLLAERFPDAVASRTSRPQIEPPASGSNASHSAPTTRERRPASAVATPAASVTPIMPSPPWQPSHTTLAEAASQSLAKKTRAIRWPWVVGASLVAIGVTVGAALALRREPDEPRAASQPSGSNEVVGEIQIVTTPPGRDGSRRRASTRRVAGGRSDAARHTHRDRSGTRGLRARVANADRR